MALSTPVKMQEGENPPAPASDEEPKLMIIEFALSDVPWSGLLYGTSERETEDEESPLISRVASSSSMPPSSVSRAVLSPGGAVRCVCAVCRGRQNGGAFG